MQRRETRIPKKVTDWFQTTSSKYVELLSQRKYNEAVALLEDVGEAYLDYGFANHILQMVKPLRKTLVSTQSLSSEKWAWLCNVVGLTYSYLQEYTKAKAKFSEMKTTGEKLEDRKIISTALQNLGICSFELGKISEARSLYLRALILKRDIGDRLGTSQLYANLASIHLEKGEFVEAERLVNKSIQIKKSLNDKRGLIGSYNTLGLLESKRGKLAEAEKTFGMILKLSIKNGDVRGIAIGLINIGSSCSEQGKYAEAITNYQKGFYVAYQFKLLREVELAAKGLAVTYFNTKAYKNSIRFFEVNLKLTKTAGKQLDYAMVHHDLGSLHVLVGDDKKATHYYQKALLHFKKLNAWKWIQITTSEMAGLKLEKGHLASGVRILLNGISLLRKQHQELETIPLYDDLIRESLSKRKLDMTKEYFQEQRAILLAAGNYSDLAFKAAMIGTRCFELNLFLDGIGFYDQAKNLYKKLENPQMLGKVLNSMGTGFQEIEDLEKAEAVQREALRLAINTHDRVLEAEARNNLGELARKMGHYRQAVTELRRSAALSKSVNDVQGIVIAANNLGLALEAMGNTKAAREMFNASLRAATKEDNKPGQARAVSSLGTLLFEQGRFRSALEHYKKALRLSNESHDKDLEAEMWTNYALTEGNLGKPQRASHSMQKAVDIALARGNYKLVVQICIASAKENIRRGEMKLSGDYLANALAASLLVSLQYSATVVQQFFLIIGELVNERKAGHATVLTQTIIRRLQNKPPNIANVFLDRYLSPLRDYLVRVNREPFKEFVVNLSRRLKSREIG